MKLLSLNVALFEKNNAALTQFLQEHDADIVCLQEVTKPLDITVDDAYLTLPAITDGTPKLTHSFFAPTWVISGFEQYDFHGKDHFLFDLGGKVEFGNSIASRFPITSAQNIFVQNHFTYITDWSNWPSQDYRAVAVVDLDVDGTPLRVLNYHGIWSRNKVGNQKTLAACKKICDLALEAENAIICGDFNLFPETESMQVFADDFISLVDTYHISTTRPDSNELQNEKRNVVDYVFISKGIQDTSFRVHTSEVSDHLPLVLEFEL